MTRNFCTLFDKNYLFKGLALHESLESTAGDYTLWILCMDQTTFDVLDKMALPNVRLLDLAEFEDPELLGIKPTRTPVEYCWTCTPSLPLYLLEHRPGLASITYLDADLYFFSDPQPLFDEQGENSVAIIGHRYSPQYRQWTVESGIYNVEFLTFKNDARGLAVLRWWRDRCIEWCYHRVEDGKMGDQKYLDDWPQRFDGVHVLETVGAGLAPWNLDSHTVSLRDGRLLVDNESLVFYHFHQFVLQSDRGQYVPASRSYRFTRDEIRLVYEPYVRELVRAVVATRRIEPDFTFGLRPRTGPSVVADVWASTRDALKRAAQSVLRRIRGEHV